MTPRHHDPDTLSAAASTAARIAGCDCRPDVDVVEEFPAMYRATVRHDTWCTLLRRAASRWN